MHGVLTTNVYACIGPATTFQIITTVTKHSDSEALCTQCRPGTPARPMVHADFMGEIPSLAKHELMHDASPLVLGFNQSIRLLVPVRLSKGYIFYIV